MLGFRPLAGAPLTSGAGSATLAAGARSFSLMGQAALLRVSMPAAAAAFALAGTGVDLSYALIGGGGDRIAGGQFSRRRWRELKDAIAAQREAQAQARARASERQRAAVREAAAAAKTARRAAWAAQDRRNAEAADIRRLADARRALSAAQDFNDALRSAAAIAAAAEQAQAQARSAALNDEDEAMVLLLLAA
jgi:hypothetical protein